MSQRRRRAPRLRRGAWVVTVRPVGVLGAGRRLRVVRYHARQDAYDCEVLDSRTGEALFLETIVARDLSEPRPLELLALALDEGSLTA